MRGCRIFSSFPRFCLGTQVRRPASPDYSRLFRAWSAREHKSPEQVSRLSDKRSGLQERGDLDGGSLSDWQVYEVYGGAKRDSPLCVMSRCKMSLSMLWACSSTLSRLSGDIFSKRLPKDLAIIIILPHAIVLAESL